MSAPQAQRVDIVGRDNQCPCNPGTDRQHDQAERHANFLAAKPGADPRTDLRTDHTADHKQHGEYDIDSLVIHRLQERDVRGDENDLEK